MVLSHLMIIKFFLFRHGETDWNLNKKFQGHSDIPLNQTGEIQALSLAHKLKSLNLKFIVSSDLIRAKRTAVIANQFIQLPILEDSNLRETHLGHAEGLTHDEIAQKFSPTLLQQWASHESQSNDFGFPGGETKRQHLVRLKAALENIVNKNLDNLAHEDQVGISTHGGCLIRLIHSCENAPAERIPIPNCALYEVHFHVKTNSWHYIRLVE